MTRSPLAIIVITAAAVPLGWSAGALAALVALYPLPAFGVFLIAGLLLIHFSGRQGRVSGVPVNAR